jgi:hypothetical protein
VLRPSAVASRFEALRANLVIAHRIPIASFGEAEQPVERMGISTDNARRQRPYQK